MKKRSAIWGVPKSELYDVVCAASSCKDVLHRLGLGYSGGNVVTLKARCAQDGIDLTEVIQRGVQTRLAQSAKTRRRSLRSILTVRSNYDRASLKARIIEAQLLDKHCQLCGLGSTWNGKPLVLVLDHINGVWDDNRLENLRLLCPNCNSQTDTFAGKNKHNPPSSNGRT